MQSLTWRPQGAAHADVPPVAAPPPMEPSWAACRIWPSVNLTPQGQHVINALSLLATFWLRRMHARCRRCRCLAHRAHHAQRCSCLNWQMPQICSVYSRPMAATRPAFPSDDGSCALALASTPIMARPLLNYAQPWTKGKAVCSKSVLPHQHPQPPLNDTARSR